MAFDGWKVSQRSFVQRVLSRDQIELLCIININDCMKIKILLVFWYNMFQVSVNPASVWHHPAVIYLFKSHNSLVMTVR